MAGMGRRRLHQLHRNQPPSSRNHENQSSGSKFLGAQIGLSPQPMRSAPLHIGLVALGMALSGCGLVAYPQRAQLPPPWFLQVSARDAVSREPITNATVRFEGRKVKNYIVFAPPLSASPARTQEEGPPHVVLTGTQIAPGLYSFEPTRRFEWSHILFPIGLPLGGVMRHYYTSSIVVEAPDHSPIRAHGVPPPNGGLGQETTSDFVEFSDKVTILLPRAAPRPLPKHPSRTPSDLILPDG